MSFDGKMWYTCACGIRVSEHSVHYLKCEVIAHKVAEWEAFEKACTTDWFATWRTFA